MARLFLDVDGVINAQMPYGWGKLSSGNRQGYRISWAPGMVDALASLPLDLTWCTTWTDKAASDIGGLIGWGTEAGYIPSADEWSYSIDWKFPAVMAEHVEGQKFVWIDDELEPNMIAWAESVGGLAIKTNPLVGITPQQIERIVGYLV